MSNEYYSAEEAMKVLKKPRSTFFKEVELGRIPFELEEGRQRGRLYPKRAIDALAKRQQVKHKDKGPSHLIFSPSSLADLWAEVQIGINLYGEDDIVPYDSLLEWRESNDEMFMSVKSKGRVVAYSSLMPLEENVLLPLLHDQIRERDIPVNAIRQWTDSRLSVYIATVTVKPTGNTTRDEYLGRYIIKHTIKWALSLHRQFDIKNWYGIGATKKGQHLFESLGFDEIVSLYDGERKGYFLSEVKKPIKLLSRFLENMENAEHSEESTRKSK